MMLYFEAALRRERRQRAAQFIDTNLATAGGKEAASHFKGLRK